MQEFKKIDNNEAEILRVKHEVQQWLLNVVIGLQLCPFAKAPFQKKQVRFSVSLATTEEELIEGLVAECEYLDGNEDVETSLLSCPNMLSDFFDYTQFLVWANQVLKKNHWQGVYQIASFHPQYQFSGTEIDDPQNLTNRSPYPILHLLRESSLENVLERYENPEDIPQKNIETMLNLTKEEKSRLFSYLL